MKDLAAYVGIGVTIWVVLLLLLDLRTRKYEFLSWRNVFLIGFVLFYGIGVYFSAKEDGGNEMYHGTEENYYLLSLTIPVFLGLFMACNLISRRWEGPDRMVPKVHLPVTSAGILLAIAMLLGAGVFASVVAMTSYVAVFANQFKAGLCNAAVALATYFLLARRFNPLAWAVFLGTLGTGVVVGMVGEIGRRHVLGAMMAVGWMWFFFRLRYASTTSVVVKLGLLGVVAFLGMAVYAGVRGTGGAGSYQESFSFTTRLEQFGAMLQNPSIEKEAVLSMVYSDAPANTMFIFETYPQTYEYIPFNGLVLFLGNPIPRQIWPDKPEGLGFQLKSKMMAPGNLGPGIIGHGWAEGGWIGVLGYAAFFGLLYGVVDRLLRDRAWNPYFVASVGSALGNVLAMARGETSLFLVIVAAGYVGTTFMLYLHRVFFNAVAVASPPLLIAEANGFLAAGAAVDGEGEWADEPHDGEAVEFGEYDARLAEEYSETAGDAGSEYR